MRGPKTLVIALADIERQALDGVARRHNRPCVWIVSALTI
jgi:hypothetical protein